MYGVDPASWVDVEVRLVGRWAIVAAARALAAALAWSGYVWSATWGDDCDRCRVLSDTAAARVEPCRIALLVAVAGGSGFGFGDAITADSKARLAAEPPHFEGGGLGLRACLWAEPAATTAAE